MGAARILGAAVQVEKEICEDDIVYTISGESAARLHDFCSQNGLGCGLYENGQFILKHSRLKDTMGTGDRPLFRTIEEGLINATAARGVARG